MPANPDFDQIAATTLEKYRPRLTDNIFKATPLFDALTRRDRIRFEDGGSNIVEPLLTGGNSTAKPYSGWDVLDITPQEGISAAIFPWKQAAASVAINGLEEAVNSGRSAVLNLLKAKIEQAESSLVDMFSEMFQGDGVNFNGAPNPKTWSGLGLLLGTGAVGGIDPAVAGNEFWLPTRVDAATVFPDPDGAGTAVAGEFTSDAAWTKAFYTASKNGTDSPDIGVTTQDLYIAYENLLSPALRFTSNAEADSRFQHLLFKGVRLHFDPYVPVGVTQFLNTKYLGLAVLKGKWLKNGPFKETPDVDGRWCQILSYGNFTIRNRQRHAVIFNQVA